jgi:tripartite-type tricarboxylate transporter receptor subunit TctC
MKLPRRKFLHLAAGAAALPAVSSIARAQTYPSRPITMVVPFPAGGAFDTIARPLADRMKLALGQPVIVENVGGANGSIGVGRVSRASPDGYTLSLGYWGTHVVNPAIYTLQYDPMKDFEPISLVVTNPLVVVSKNALPAKDLRELIAWLKANPDKATLATVGSGSPPHVAGLFLQKLTGTRFQFVPYRGGGPATQDLVAGQVDLSILQAGVVLPQVRAGRIRAYAVTAKTRLSSAPEIPAADEAGVPVLHVDTWSGLWAPKATPASIIAKLNAAVVDALADGSVRQRLAEIGQEIFPREQQTPEALAAFQKVEIEKWWPIIKAANIKVE